MPLNFEIPYFRKILVGYDRSPLAEKAVDVAIRFGVCEKASISVLAVARLPEPATSVEVEAILDDARVHYEQGLKQMVPGSGGAAQTTDTRKRAQPGTGELFASALLLGTRRKFRPERRFDSFANRYRAHLERLLLDRKRTTIDSDRVRSDLKNLSKMLVADMPATGNEAIAS